jgi:hypothetical protein
MRNQGGTIIACFIVEKLTSLGNKIPVPFLAEYKKILPMTERKEEAKRLYVNGRLMPCISICFIQSQLR